MTTGSVTTETVVDLGTGPVKVDLQDANQRVVLTFGFPEDGGNTLCLRFSDPHFIAHAARVLAEAGVTLASLMARTARSAAADLNRGAP